MTADLSPLPADWMAAWQPMIDGIGQDFAPGLDAADADPIERSTVRRYLEPLEFDCPLHYDADVARAYGYADIVLPCTALQTFSLAPAWRPGETIFDSAERNAQPTRSAGSGVRSPPGTADHRVFRDGV